MDTIKTHNNSLWDMHLSGTDWYHTSVVSVRGYLFDRSGTLYRGESLCKYFTVNNIKELQERLEQSNGLFAVICHSEILNAAAIDSSRIYPLYYRIDSNRCFLITDTASSLLSPDDTLDPMSTLEYNMAGFTLNGKTLISTIHQIKPGHFLTTNGQQPYYSYLTYTHELTHTNSDQMCTMLQNVFRRLIKSVGNRQLVVPLSGGNDSRLILCMLRELGYSNVICYTVGRANNPEEIIAKQVAQSLSYPLYVIDTTNTSIQSYVKLDTKEFQQYYQFIGGLNNFVWLFEYVAIQHLRSLNVLAQNAVFIPGHSADYNAGSHLTKACIRDKSSIEYMVRSIMHDHFEYEYHHLLRKDILHYFQKHNQQRNIAKWSIYQSFIFENRLPYNINNSARVYEFFGYDVRLPYWDKEFLEFFRKLPISNLYHSHFYIESIRQHFFIPMGVDLPNKQLSTWFFYKAKLRKRIKHLFPLSLVHLRTKANDILGERELAQSMLEELIQHGVYRNKRYAYSANQIMKDWYLMKVQQMLHSH